MGQIQHELEQQLQRRQTQSDFFHKSVSRLSAEIHLLNQNVALSLPFEMEVRHAIEDISRLKATFEARGIALAFPPDFLTPPQVVA